MNAVLAPYQHAIEALCRQYHVRRLELFGSAATGRFRPNESDIDLLVVFEELPPGTYANSYFGLLHALEDLFGRHVDLVSADTIENPYLRESIDESRVLVYAA
jgi:predicted nucleotidyltransferase